MTVASHPEYRADIDGLRAIAILLVCIFHFRLFPLGEAGFIGVDVFFVLSGFLITRILVRDMALGTFTLGGFYLARLRRLMPALVATLILYLIVAYFAFLPDRFAELSIESILSQLYVVNIYFWRTINYFGLRADHVPLLHMWSLSIEEQFYIFYPLALLAIFRFARKLLIPFVVIGLIGSFLLGWWATGWKPEASFYLLPTRAWELLAGGLLAILRPQGHLTGRLAHFVGPMGLAVLAFALFIHTPVTAFPGWYASLPVIASVLIIMSAPASATGRVLSFGPMVWFGKISYPLYLVHWPIIILMREIMADYGLVWRWGSFAVAIALAWVIWRFVESPIRQRRILASPRQFLMGAAATTGILLAVSVVGFVTKGLPDRFSEQVQTYLAFSDDLPKEFVSCELKADSNPDRPCPLGEASDTPVFAVIGDSHSQALAPAFDIWGKSTDQAGALFFHHACMPITDAGGRLCPAFVNRAMTAVVNNSDIKQVFLVSSWMHDKTVYGGVYLEGVDADQALANALQSAVDRLLDAGKEVILVDPAYNAQSHVPKTLARNEHFNLERPLDRPLTEHNAAFAAVHAAFDTVAEADGVRRISLTKELCASGTCTALFEGKPVFTDSDHYRRGMGDHFANQLSATMNQ